MINKKIHESEDPESLDLKDVINQARLFGLTQSEKTAILKVRIELYVVCLCGDFGLCFEVLSGLRPGMSPADD